MTRAAATTRAAARHPIAPAGVLAALGLRLWAPPAGPIRSCGPRPGS
jgi:hypothetical protein